jgi:C-terminal processing protease CtpA/Prc
MIISRTVLSLAVAMLLGSAATAQDNVKHPRGSKQPAKHGKVSVQSNTNTATVKVKNGVVYVNDSAVSKLANSESDEIIIYYTQADETAAPDNEQPKANTDRPRIGVLTANFYDEGAMVQDVMPYSPADRAGIRPGDVIIRINGYSIDNPDQLMDVLSRFSPGEEVSVSFVRNRTVISAQVKLEERQRYHEPEMDRYPRRWRK